MELRRIEPSGPRPRAEGGRRPRPRRGTSPGRRPSVGRGLCLAIGLVGASLVLAACSSTPKAPSTPVLPSIEPDASFPPDLSLPPEDSLPPDESFPPDVVDPSDAILTPLLRHGTATVEITSGSPMTIHMPHIGGDGPSMMDPDIGVDVTWRGGDWELRVQGGEMLDPTVVGDSGLTLIREDTDTPLLADGTSCTITYSVETPVHVAGRATCTNLTWTDAFDGSTGDLPGASGSPAASAPALNSPGSDLPPFNATITFDATP